MHVSKNTHIITPLPLMEQTKLEKHEENLIKHKINQEVLYCLHSKNFIVLFNPNTLNPCSPNNFYPSIITYTTHTNVVLKIETRVATSSFISEACFQDDSDLKEWKLHNFYHNTQYPSIITSEDINSELILSHYIRPNNRNTLVQYLLEKADNVMIDSFIYQGTIAFHVSNKQMHKGQSEVITCLSQHQIHYFKYMEVQAPEDIVLLHLTILDKNTFLSLYGNRRLFSMSAHETLSIIKDEYKIERNPEMETTMIPSFLRNRDSLINKETFNLNGIHLLPAINWRSVFDKDYLNANLDDALLFPTSFRAPIQLRERELIVI